MSDDTLKSEPRLYRVIWRWHFYAGLIVTPILLIASITGALYIFKSELEPVMYPQMFVAPQSSVVALETQVETARHAVASDAKLLSVRVSSDVRRATEIAFRSGARGSEKYDYVFVNQHTGQTQGVLRYGETFFDVVLKIHTDLYAGTPGRILVELAASWSLVLILTGVYLWIPQKRRGARDWKNGVLVPRVTGKRYVIWRDWHTVPGFYLAVLAFLVLLSGLFFAYLFGQGYQAITYLSGGYPESMIDPPASTKQFEAQSPDSLDRIISTIRAQGVGGDLNVEMPHDATSSFAVYAMERDNAHPTRTRHFVVDQYTGRILSETRWADLSALAKLNTLAYPVHVGSIYGLPTKILALLACLILIALSITGAVMWWLRRPTGKTGFPKKPERRIERWVILLIVVSGVVMPTVGASLLIIIAVDKLRQWIVNRRATASPMS